MLGISTVSTGGTSGTTVDAKVVFVLALKAKAFLTVLSQNHSFGNLLPSKQEKRPTRRLVEIGGFLDVRVMDHISLSREGYYSFVDEGDLRLLF